MMFKPAVSLNLSRTEMMYEVPQKNLPSKVCWIVEDIRSQGATEQRQKPRTLRFLSLKLVARGGRSTSFQKNMHNFLDAALDNLNTRFPQGLCFRL